MNHHRRRVLGAATFQDVVRDKREDLMKRILAMVNKEGAEFGLEVVDVRIKRADLPEQNSKSVFDRMRAERQREAAEFRKSSNRMTVLLVVGTVLTLLVGTVAPVSFMQHFIVFALSCFVGFYVIWNVSHALHTPLMAITNGISSIIILGALLQIGSNSFFVALLAALATLMASVNIFGGFLVTRRMLAMFQKS